MNREDLGNLALALFGLFFILSGILQLPFLLQAYRQSILFILGAITSIVLGGLIWAYSPGLLKYIYRSKAVQAQPLDRDGVAVTLLSVMGLYLVLTSLPQLIFLLFETSRPTPLVLNTPPSIQPLLVRNVVSTSLRVAAGVFIAIRPCTVLTVISKLQGSRS